MRKLIILLLLCPKISMAQEKGIQFEQSENWQQVIAKASQQNKMIFVDCYATWCGPCKMMDARVYPDDTVGLFMNGRFISIKIQMDSSAKDNETVKNWYKTAGEFTKEYKINGYPSFLLFSSDGQPLYKFMGASDKQQFIERVNKGLNQDNQYYALLRQYKAGKLSKEQIAKLPSLASQMGDDEAGLEIAKNYMHQYLDKLDEDDFLKKENLMFIHTNAPMITTKDRVFKLYEKATFKVDTIMGIPNYSVSMASLVISNELIKPYYDAAIRNNNKEIDWDKIETGIRKKYRFGYAEENLLTYKVNWYKRKKDWKQYSKYLVDLVDAGVQKTKSEMSAIFFLNNNAYEIFKYSSDKRELEHAITWIDLALPLAPTYAAGMLDTKANLLYKLGRVEEAISLETRVVNMRPLSKEFQKVIQKMKDGKPTWETN